MIPLLLANAAVALGSTPLTFERPWDSTSWKAEGDYVAGTDVFRLGTKFGTATSLWTTNPVPWDEWTYEIVFRTFAGKEQPGHSGIAFLHTSDILGMGGMHGADQTYDGLAVTVDSMGWDEHNRYPDEDQGAVRGHLNDGSTSFSSHPAAEAFSLCRMPYRKTAEPVTLKIGYGRGVFAVEVNNQRCFTSDAIVLPQGYFGLSSSTGLSEDTFAIDSLRITEGLDPLLEKHFEASQLEGPTPKKGSSISYSKDEAVQFKEAAGAAAGAAAGIPALTTRDLDKLSEALYRMESRLDDVQKGVESNQNKIDALSVASGNSDASNLIEKLLERVGRLESQIDSLKAAQDSHSQELRSVGSKVDSVTGKVDKLPTHTTEASKYPASAGPSLLGPCLVLLVGQGVLYAAFQSWSGRREKHQKLL